MRRGAEIIPTVRRDSLQGSYRRRPRQHGLAASLIAVACALVLATPTSAAAGPSKTPATATTTTSTSTIRTLAGSFCSPGIATGWGMAPAAVVDDGVGGFYVADSTYAVVCHIDGGGVARVVAGNGAMGYLGDGGPATATELYMPSGLAVGRDGSVFIADRSNQRVRRVDAATGVITTVAGTGQVGYADGPSSSALLNYPAGLAISGSSLYIADTKNNRVRRADLVTGVVSTVAGNGAAGSDGDGGLALLANLTFPTAVAVDIDGSVLIADSGNDRVRRVDAAGIITTVAGTSAGFSGDGSPATSARLHSPMSVAARADGVYVADSANNRIRRIDRTGVITTVVGNGTASFSGDGGAATAASVNYPMGVAVTSSGSLLVVDSGNLRVRQVATDSTITTRAGNGTRGYSGDGGGAAAAELNEPIGVASAPDGSVVIADSLNHVVRRVSTAGVVTTVAGVPAEAGFGGDGGAAVNAHLEFPTGLVVDGHGAIYIADRGNNRVRKVTPDGKIRTVAGSGAAGYSGDGGAATSAALSSPSALALGPDGSFYIADTANNRVRRVRTNGTITTTAGTGTASFGGDGGPAAAAGLNQPNGVAIGSQGVLFIADTNNQRIRSVDLKTGTIRTLAGTGVVGYSGSPSPAASSLWNFPTGVALDTGGNLYVADKGNCIVRKVAGAYASAPTVSTVVGWPPARSIAPVCGFSGEGTPPYGGGTMLYNPTSVALDTSGALLIADSLTNRVRRVTAPG